MVPIDHDLVTQLREALLAAGGVRLAYLFGSRAKERARPESDYDVAVLVEERDVEDARSKKNAIFRLAGALGRVVPSDRIDIVLLNDAPALLRHEVIRDGWILVEGDPGLRVRFEAGSRREYFDGQHRSREQVRVRLRSLREGVHEGRSSDLLAEARLVARLLGEAVDIP